MALLIFLRLVPILQLLLPPPLLPQQRLLESLAQEETTLEMLHRGLTCQAHIIPILAEVIWKENRSRQTRLRPVKVSHLVDNDVKFRDI